jgi:hypothetical protein
MHTLQNSNRLNMNNFKTFFFCFMLAISFKTLNAQSDNKDVIITSSGSGATMEDAKQSALRSATEQAFGAFISSKTEMFNDQVVADQMASVSSGNIKSFDVLNQAQLPDGRWAVTLKAILSVDKLTSFVQAKGIAVEIKGGMFALNIKQQLLNEQGEVKAIAEMVGVLHEPMQISFDYKIISSDPKSLDAESQNWEIPLEVTAICNKNIDFCSIYANKTLEALSLSSEEVETYKKLNKQVFPLVTKYLEKLDTFYLRQKTSIEIIKSLTSNWEFYVNNFQVQSGTDQILGSTKKGKVHEFYSTVDIDIIDFLTEGTAAGIYSWNDNKTLNQIEQMTGYNVKSNGVVSFFKNGGYVVYENAGQGIVASLIDFGPLAWNASELLCTQLSINGYSDWHIPSLNELKKIENKLFKLGIGGFSNKYFWNSTESYGEKACAYSFNLGWAPEFCRLQSAPYYLRPVRTFSSNIQDSTLKVNQRHKHISCETVYTTVDEMPQFPGGVEKLREYLKLNLNYPSIVRDNGLTGTVYVSFIVEVDGMITNVREQRGLNKACNEESIRIVKSMPIWNPGKLNGKTVRVEYSLPITFKNS